MTMLSGDTRRQYYIGVGVKPQFKGALLCFALALLCLAVILEPLKHSVTLTVLCGFGLPLFLLLMTGALINAWRVGAAKFRIFFWPGR